VTLRHHQPAAAAIGPRRRVPNAPDIGVIAGLEPIDSYLRWLTLFSLNFGYERAWNA
jgi:hypothetical protein